MTIPTDPGLVAPADPATDAYPPGPAAPSGHPGPVIAEPGQITRGRLVVRRFLRRKVAVAGLVVLASLFLVAFLGPLVYKWDHTTSDFESFLQGPSANHWFGTTQTGKDVFAQTLRGMQKSLIIGLLTAFFSTGIAAVVGACAGYFGG